MIIALLSLPARGPRHCDLPAFLSQEDGKKRQKFSQARAVFYLNQELIETRLETSSSVVDFAADPRATLADVADGFAARTPS
jgi:hypothetical protein